MTAMTTEPRPSEAPTQVVEWRLGQLLRSGFEPADANALAARLDVDLHEALELVRRGCAPKTALRILL